METELKMRFCDPSEVERFLDSEWIEQFILPDSCVKIEMLSRYYDTADKTLTRMGSSFRIRDEDENRVAAVKHGTESSQGLHQRQEWELTVKSDSDIYNNGNLDLLFFEQHAISNGDPDDRLHRLVAAVGGDPLMEICQARYSRIACDIGFGETLIEMAVDIGELKAGRLTEDLCEIELELKSGDVRNIMSLGEELMKRFNLEPETSSKYARCLDLLARQANA